MSTSVLVVSKMVGKYLSSKSPVMKTVNIDVFPAPAFPVQISFLSIDVLIPRLSANFSGAKRLCVEGAGATLRCEGKMPPGDAGSARVDSLPMVVSRFMKPKRRVGDCGALVITEDLLLLSGRKSRMTKCPVVLIRVKRNEEACVVLVAGGDCDVQTIELHGVETGICSAGTSRCFCSNEIKWNPGL